MNILLFIAAYIIAAQKCGINLYFINQNRVCLVWHTLFYYLLFN